MKTTTFSALLLLSVGACACPPERPVAMATCTPSATTPPPAEAHGPGASASACRPPNAEDERDAKKTEHLVPLCRSVLVDRETTPEQRARIKEWYSEALANVTTFLGASKEPPPGVVVCATDPCGLYFAGPTRRARAFMEPVPWLVIDGLNELTKGTLVHEMIHIGVARRMGPRRPALSTWFEEGVATFIGDNVVCAPNAAPVIDDLRRLREGYAWENFANFADKKGTAYCQARNEIAVWVRTHSRKALVDVIDAVSAGTSFDDAYGALAQAPTSPSPDRLDGKFAFDENADTNGIDSSGQPHLATLMNGASWTKGHGGSGVKVTEGAHVRAGGFLDYGLPDKPFSISLWAKPLTNAHVLVHTARTTSGGNGWCMPLLGYDEQGHLVAQVSYAANENSFLSAIGPKIPLNAWVHLGVTWSAAEGVRLYVNGALAASGVPETPAERHRQAPASPTFLFLGGNNGAHCWTKAVEPGSWNGVVDELHVYNYALTADQMKSDMRKAISP